MSFYLVRNPASGTLVSDKMSPAATSTAASIGVDQETITSRPRNENNAAVRTCINASDRVIIN